MRWEIKIIERSETSEGTRGKIREFIGVKIVGQQNENEDGEMRELKESFEVIEVGKHSRGKSCKFVIIETKRKWR